MERGLLKLLMNKLFEDLEGVLKFIEYWGWVEFWSFFKEKNYCIIKKIKKKNDVWGKRKIIPLFFSLKIKINKFSLFRIK